MDSICPNLSALFIFLVIYACVCLVVSNIVVSQSGKCQAKRLSSDSIDSGIESNVMYSMV